MPEPAFNPTLYASPLVHCNVIVLVPTTLALRFATEPKLRLIVLILQRFETVAVVENEIPLVLEVMEVHGVAVPFAAASSLLAPPTMLCE